MKKKKDNYYSCLDDILAEFEGKSMSELAQLGDSLNREILPPSTNYRKIRIENSLRSEGKSGGFRLYCVFFINDDKVILLHVYPKTGRLAGVDPGSKGRIDLIREMVAQNGQFYILDMKTKRFILPPEV